LFPGGKLAAAIGARISVGLVPCPWILPVLPLENHFTDYYVTVAVIGPGMLACAGYQATRRRVAAPFAVRAH